MKVETTTDRLLVEAERPAGRTLLRLEPPAGGYSVTGAKLRM